MKKLSQFIVILLLIFGLYNTHKYRNQISTFITNEILRKEIILEDSNEYKRDYDFMYVQNTDNFYPKNYQELLNIFYTILNNGWNKFTFYCDDNYDNCLSDVNRLIDNSDLISNINNYVHPYNSYKSIYVSTNTLGQIDVETTKNYSEDDIKIIDQNIDTIISSIIKDNMSDKNKIKAVHDYIINHTKYDSVSERTIYSDGKIEYKYSSNTALGPVKYNVGICGGYTDYMELFLEKLNIKSYKISSDDHIWNYVYVDNKWLHLDLTWDDPVTTSGNDILVHDYFLIDTNHLLKLDTKDHTYNKNIFIEN